MSDPCRTRREFLRCSTGCVALTLASFGLPAELSALPVMPIEGTAVADDHKYPIPGADSVNIDRTAQVIVVRYQNHLFGMSLVCPHEHAAVKWVEKESRFQCTKHNSRYQQDGLYTSGRATRNLDRFPIRLEAPSIVIDASRMWQSDKNPTEWAAATVALS